MIEELNRFVSVCRSGSITRAAEQSYISQSGMTQSVMRLEKELNIKLFTRKGKQLQLTKEGESILIISKKILSLWDNAHNPQFTSSSIASFNLGLFDNVALKLGKLFKNKIKNTKYSLELTVDTSTRLFQYLNVGVLDAAICIVNNNYQIPSHIRLIGQYKEELIPVTAKVFKDPIIQNAPFILYNKGSNTRTQIDEAFAEKNFNPFVFAESTSMTFMRELAVLGSGITLLPANFISIDLQNGILKRQPLPFKLQRKYGLYSQEQYDINTLFIGDIISALKDIM